MNNFVLLENSFFGPDFLDSLMEQFGALCSISRLWKHSPFLCRSGSNLLLGRNPAGLTTLQHKYPPLPEHFSSLHLTFSLPVSFLSLISFPLLFRPRLCRARVLFTSFSFGRLAPRIRFLGVKLPSVVSGLSSHPLSLFTLSSHHFSY